MQAGGVKYDMGKFRWSLMPWDALTGLLTVIEYGAGKYPARNWEKGMDWSRPFDALQRHLLAWWGGENTDPDTGYSHLWHAMWNITVLVAYEIRGIGADDRPAVEPQVP